MCTAPRTRFATRWPKPMMIAAVSAAIFRQRCRTSAADFMLRVALAVGLAGLTLPVSGGAPPTLTAELARCGALLAGEERLACYDALKCGALTDDNERLACYDALAKAKSARPPTAPIATAGSDSARGDAGFGAVQLKKPPKPQGPEQIKATVTKVSAERQGTVSVLLDNGQTWTLHESEPRLTSGDLVTIRRASLGSFLLITSTRHSYRVQRTQ
jgi:hypothetical protein